LTKDEKNATVEPTQDKGESVMRTGTFIGLVTLAASTASHASADVRPTGWEATYRVTVNLDFSGTGVALPNKGWMITAQSLFAQCGYSIKDGDCVVRVEDAERNFWIKADLVAIYTRYGLALIHLREEIPAMATYANRAAAVHEPVHALSYNEKDRRFFAGNVSGMRILQLDGEPVARRQLPVSSIKCSDCSNGTPIFTLEGQLLGVHIGTVDADVAEGEAAREDDVMLTANDLRTLVEWYRPAYERKSAQAAKNKK
jgi:hypothetical protein